MASHTGAHELRDPPSAYSPSGPWHKPRQSVATEASGIAESTLSMGTYATGITGESLRLSQFPPPPSTLPSTPSSSITTQGFPASPSAAQLNARAAHTPSPLRRPASAASSSPSSPATQTQHPAYPAQLAMPPRLGPPPPGRRPAYTDAPPPPAAGSARGSSPPTRQVSPYDWHDGSSSIDQEPPEGRMLRTSLITDLLSSADSVISNGTAASSAFPHQPRPAARYPSASQFSEMTYPPPVARAPAHHLDAIHDVLASAGNDNDTLASYEGAAQVQVINARSDPPSAGGLARKVSVVGVAPARSTLLRHVASGESSFLAQSLASGRESRSTYDSGAPLYASSRPRPASQAVPEDIEEPPYSSFPRPGDGEGSVEAMMHSRPPTVMRSAGARSRRASTQSNRSLKSQVSSFVSAAGDRAARAAERTLEWFRVKPLPSVPVFHNMDALAAEQQRVRAREERQSLPTLARRADRLGGLLAQGRLPANSTYVDGDADPDFGPYAHGAEFRKVTLGEGDAVATGSRLSRGHGGRKRQSIPGGAMLDPTTPGEAGAGSPSKTRGQYFPRLATKKQKVRFGIIVAVAAVLVIIAVVVGVVVGSKKSSGASTCSGRMTGNDCSLDATCVCTSHSSSAGCNPIAASLVNLLPTVNELFAMNMSTADVSTSMTAAFGAVVNNDCSRQARTIDVSPALGSSTPNRTMWAQAALMWSVVLSQSDTQVGSLRGFVRGADWRSVASVDGPIVSTGSRFQTTQLGFMFDFAAQTVRAPAVSFEQDGQPSSAQFAKTDGTTQAALDTMYTTASAMSTMRSSAMKTYWQSTLGQDPAHYATFAALMEASPILLPFNANSSASALLTNSTTAPFPPPQACNPNLSSAALAQISTVETAVFGLSAPKPPAGFDTACFADRPIYGRLDYLRLRTPFRSAAENTSAQAATLQPAARPRVVVSHGAQFAALPLGAPPPAVQTDRRMYGTLGHMDHVLYSFFSAIEDTATAIALVQYILSQASVPPTAPTLLNALQTLPVLEVAVLGTVTPDDLSTVVSSFADPAGGLWFGTDQSLALRQWAINGLRTGVTWAINATASTAVHDTSFDDASFNAVWNPAFMFFHSTTNTVVGVSNVTDALQAVGKFTP